MSGGPCFDKQWHVVAVCSSGWSSGDFSCAALLWPSMHIEVDLYKTGKFRVFDRFTTGPRAQLAGTASKLPPLSKSQR
jgi:hypothetical protein